MSKLASTDVFPAQRLFSAMAVDGMGTCDLRLRTDEAYWLDILRLIGTVLVDVSNEVATLPTVGLLTALCSSSAKT